MYFKSHDLFWDLILEYTFPSLQLIFNESLLVNVEIVSM